MRLQALSLDNNQLTGVPEAITLLAGLRVINLRGNDLIAIPEEFLAQSRSSAQSILRYYTDWLTKPKRRLNEAKVLLVGEGRVGKTSLVNRMIDNEFHSDEKLSYQNGLNTALVKADPEAGVIAIWVTGNGATRRDFLNVIRGHFEHIHRSLKREVAEYVPIPGHPGIAPELYSDLLALRGSGRADVLQPQAQAALEREGIAGRRERHLARAEA